MLRIISVAFTHCFVTRMVLEMYNLVLIKKNQPCPVSCAFHCHLILTASQSLIF